MADRIEVFANAGPWSRHIELLICINARDGQKYAVSDAITFTKVNDGEHVPPTLKLDHTAVQELIDSLWASGLRPTDGSGSAGAFAAQGRHLEDLRTLVFKDKSHG